MLNFKKTFHLRLKKNKFVFFRLFNKNSLVLLNEIKKIRIINKYTQKGIKPSRLVFLTRNKKKK
jgi:hypothetical protein